MDSNVTETIWAVDFTVSPPSFGGLSRFYYFKRIIDNNYKNCELTIFTSSFFYNHSENYFRPFERGICKNENFDGVTLSLIKTPRFHSLISRIFSINLFAHRFSRILKSTPAIKRPSLIYVSVSPELSLAKIVEKAAKRLEIPVILEIRDLYPETLVALGKINKQSIVFSAVNRLAKKVYYSANSIVFTIPGGKQYIKDKRWDISSGGRIDLRSVYHITNGIDIAQFCDEKKNVFEDDDLRNACIKIAYTGTISRSNDIEYLLKIAKRIKNQNIRFLIWGSGSRANSIKQIIRDENITNVIFKGFISNSFVPYILSKVDATIFLLKKADIYKYGISLNKIPKYMASSKPIIFVGECNYSIVDHYKCGITINNEVPEQAARQIENFFALPKFDREKMGENGKNGVKEYDYSALTGEFLKVVEDVLNK